MKLLYIDCPTGASGNMLLAALISAGNSKEFLLDELSKLPLNNYQLEFKDVTKNGIAASFLKVIESEKSPARSLSDILYLINSSNLSTWTKEKSCQIFNNLAKAEAKVHNTTVEHIHFHEVGALDAIIDIVGTVIAIEKLQIETIKVSPLPLGSGVVKCQHGLLPVPTPATLELVKGIPLKQTELQYELLTPTGAAILSALADDFGPIPAMTIKSIGLGAGSHDLPTPNILRILVGEMEEALAEQMISVIECNIDDMNPELYPFLVNRIFELNALDAFITPVIMKKGRPGHMLTVLCALEHESAITKFLLSETTSLGVRTRHEIRYINQREVIVIKTTYGEVSVKLGIQNSVIVNVAPEFEDCKKLAQTNSIPIKTVYQAALVEAHKYIKNKKTVV